ncbi:glucuronate isomerase [Vibrio superstes]|uniref:Uronate isomerase n=1 Tax=Vibrio superstes NBRC 103154 TaxID=1219062 RepID=A0A511QN63_9VIBR|nr:glucuronate isomerase [Vibrio superstes]GEM78768.1 uronate isomerase [Vibrio superstes NBRC 103154]
MYEKYIHDNVLLTSSLAQHLYHSYASQMPIIDYHNHLDAKDIWFDTKYKNLAEAWLHSDHYVWRAMRSNGISEHYITGNASDIEKFQKWCEAMPFLLGNPLYQWSHLELKRFFNCELLLNPSNSNAIWAHCNNELKNSEMGTQSVLRKLNVDTLCTTDSPLSDLKYHQRLKCSDFHTKVLPTFRADPLISFADVQGFLNTLEQLSQLTSIKICSLRDYIDAIGSRVDFFHEVGCRLSDIGLPRVNFYSASIGQCEGAFLKLLTEQALSDKEIAQLTTYVLNQLGKLYHQYQWTQQLHIGVLANVNQRRKLELGPGTGFTAIQNELDIEALAQQLNALDQEHMLPKTVLYNLNANHNQLLSCLAGAFQSDDAAGKIQFGAAWWFNDHKDGMEAQLTTLKNLGALGRFVGMLTDSRNLFSFSRHEYFRRVLCNQLARWVEDGEIPYDLSLLKQTIENICYHNANNYFNFKDIA